MSDAELVVRLKDRDEDAYREVLARYSDPLYRYLYGITGDMQLSQDLLGDTFLRVVEQIDRYTYQGVAFKAWLYRIAHNLAINALKRDRPLVAVEDLEQVARPITGPAIRIAAQLEEAALRAALRASLPELTEEQQQVIVLRFLNERRGFLGSDETIAIVAQFAAALDAAHAVGIIHRDVKPANALWNAAGTLVLTDFGIAKDTVGAVNQTQAGVVMGTPTYMAPEQGQGLPLTPATDIYALGVILYELLAGRLPFDASTPLAVVLQHIQALPPPLGAIRPDLPPAVEGVVQRALAKEPRDRYASAGALAAALRQAWTIPAAGSVHQLATQAWTPC